MTILQCYHRRKDRIYDNLNGAKHIMIDADSLYNQHRCLQLS
jgi:hypothetical protein